MSGLPALMLVFCALRVAAPQTLEDAIEIHDLPAISAETTVGDLLLLDPFKDSAKKIELRVIYTDGSVVKTADPTTDSPPGGGSFKTWKVERYAPGFVKETYSSAAGVTTKFDGEDRKKALRTKPIAGTTGPTFKDKGGAVAVIVKKAAAVFPMPVMLERVVYAIVGFALGLLIAWAAFRRRRGRAASP